jgi:hypothetical protein
MIVKPKNTAMASNSKLSTTFLLLIVLGFISLSTSCTYNKEDELYGTACDTSNVKYSVEIKGILSSSCLNCHNSTSQQGGVNLASYENVKEWVDNGGLLESVIRENNPMPKGAPRLASCKINQIRAWINKGAPNN